MNPIEYTLKDRGTGKLAMITVSGDFWLLSRFEAGLSLAMPELHADILYRRELAQSPPGAEPPLTPPPPAAVPN